MREQKGTKGTKMLFAETNFPDATWPLAMQVLAGLLGLLGAYVLILNAVVVSRKAFGKTPPLHDQVIELRNQFAREIARIDADLRANIRDHEQDDAQEFSTLRSELRGVEAKLESKIADNNSASERRVDGIYERLNDINKDLTAKIEDQPARIIGLLKNTGAI